MIIGIDHGYYAIKTKAGVFPNRGCAVHLWNLIPCRMFFNMEALIMCVGRGWQTLVKDKTVNDNYYLLTLAALAQEIRKRKGERTAKVVLAAGFPLLGLEGKNRNLRNICFGRNSLSAFSTKGNAMKSRLRM